MGDSKQAKALAHAQFVAAAKRFDSPISSYIRAPDGSGVTTLRGDVDGVPSILTYDSRTGVISLTTVD